jgi:ubiquinone/menaquinone biosynthesis C-methylase UbiE
VYEEVFEPLSLAFAREAIARLGVRRGDRVLDVGAGPGGAAIAMARLGGRVTAVDASPGMVDRTLRRARAAGVDVDARVMDGGDLDFADGSFHAALSVFGVILFPDAVRALREMCRVVRPGGRAAVVTWTQPGRYELAANLREAILATGPDAPGPANVPAQLRFAEPQAFRRLFEEAGVQKVEIEDVESRLCLPSARWLADRIDFAPGMAAWVGGLGERRGAVLDQFVRRLERSHGQGQLELRGVASIAVGLVI